MGGTDREAASFPSTLRIRFGEAERPYLFWISSWVEDGEGSVRFKVLSKQRPDRSLEVLVIQEGDNGRRKTVAHVEVPRSFPSGWLERWVTLLAYDLSTAFESFDLRQVQTHAQWVEVAARLGWSLEG